jgi:hypothetical protein
MLCSFMPSMLCVLTGTYPEWLLAATGLKGVAPVVPLPLLVKLIYVHLAGVFSLHHGLRPLPSAE